MAIVFEYHSKNAVFTGTYDECLRWILDKAFTFKDGRKIYRTWQEGKDTVYDVGTCYILNK